MTKVRSIVDVKAHFAQYVREAEQGEAVVLTRHGRSVAAIVPIDLVEDLARLRAAGPAGGLASVAGGWKGSQEVAEKALEYGRSVGRPLPDLDRG